MPPTLIERVERLEKLVSMLQTVLRDFPGRTAEQLEADKLALQREIQRESRRCPHCGSANFRRDTEEPGLDYCSDCKKFA